MSIFQDLTNTFSHNEKSGQSHEHHPETITYLHEESTSEGSEFLNDELRMVDQPLDGFE